MQWVYVLKSINIFKISVLTSNVKNIDSCNSHKSKLLGIVHGFKWVKDPAPKRLKNHGGRKTVI